jgi:hypothetical protein
MVEELDRVTGRDGIFRLKDDHLRRERGNDRHHLRRRAQHRTDTVGTSIASVSLLGQKHDIRSNCLRDSPKLICLDAGQEDGGIRACECVRHELAVHFECWLRWKRNRLSERLDLLDVNRKENCSPRTRPVSSPGRAANFSPTWTIPLSIRPDTASPDAVAD